jgi:integrase
VRYEVRWWEQSRNRARVFDRHADAHAWDAEVRRRRQLGALALSQLTSTTPTLDAWIAQRWAPEHAANLEQSTRDRYANVYRCHIEPWLGDVPLAELTVGRLRSWQLALLEADTPPATIHKARTLLSSVLRHAAEAEVIPGNPLPLVRAPRPPQRDRVRPLAPATVETIRRHVLEPQPREVAASKSGRRRRAYTVPGRAPEDRRRDALIVSLLAYAGLRPGELHALRWQDVRERTLLIERATAPDGTIKTTKNNRARSIRLLPALAAELREWRLASGRPADEALVIPGPSGDAWTKTDWQNWRSRQWRRACREAGLDPVPRPYDLRHSFASLLLAERHQPLYVALQLGHTPAVLLSTYAHLLPEFADAERVEPELEIAKARENA